MIKIAYILTPIDFGGSEQVSLSFLNNVDRTIFDIYPILLIRPWEEDGVFVGKLKSAKYQTYKIPVALKPRSEKKDYFRVIRCIRRLYSIISHGSFQLIHTHGYFADIIGIIVSKMMRIPLISTCHGYISNDKNLVLYNRLDQMLLRFSDKIIAVSEQIKEDLEKSGIKESKITVIQNAVQNIYNAETYKKNRQKKRLDFAIKDREFIIGFAGRLSDEKGVKYLIEAGVHLLKTMIPYMIWIIGDGPKRQELEDMVKMKGLEEKIVFIGFQTNIEEWLPAIDVFVLPSLTEGTPMALLEAMAFGLPVIASDVGGIPKIINSGNNGILVPAANADKIKDAISMIWEYDSLRSKISGIAKKTIRSHFNINEWVKKIESVYVEAIRDRN